MKLDEVVQLHEDVHIIYVVDRYEATLHTQDGGKVVLSEKGDSVIEALVELEKAVHRQGLDLEKVRKGGKYPKILSKPLILQRRAKAIEDVAHLESCLSSAGDRRDADSCDYYEEQLAKAKAQLELLNELSEYQD